MYPRHEVFGDLPRSEVVASLNACVLGEKDEYTEDEVYRFIECRQLIEKQGKTYDEVAQIFQQNGLIPIAQPQLTKELQPTEPDTSSKAKKSKNEKKPAPEPLDFSKLLDDAKELLGSGIPPKEAIQLLSACGLSADAEQYSQKECDRFLEACELLKQQNKSIEEVAAHFGRETAKTDPPSGLDRLLELLGGSVLAADEQLFSLINKITAKQASRTDIERLVQWSYLENVSRLLDGNQNNTSTLLDELELRVMDYIEGKSSARSLQTNWDWAPNSLPSSSPKPMILPEGSENGMSGE